MANDQRRSLFRRGFDFGGERVAAWAYAAGPVALIYGFGQHAGFAFGLALVSLTAFQVVVPIALIATPPIDPPPRDAPLVLAIIAAGLTPLLLFIVWPGDPFAFRTLATIAVTSFVVMPASQLAALLVRRPSAAVRLVLLGIGALASLAFLAAYLGLALALTQGASAELLHPQAVQRTLLIGAPATPLFGFVAFLMILTMVKPPASP